MLEYKQLLNMLGTYLSKNFQEDPFVKGLFTASLRLQEQVEQDLEELLLSAYRKRIPVYHRELAYTLLLDPKNRNKCDEAIPRHGQQFLRFSDDGFHRFGEHTAIGCWYSCPLADVVSIEKIVDDPVNPTVELLPGADFEVDGGAIRFTADPCDGDAPRELFMVNVECDKRWIYRHFGYLLGLESSSSPEYRTLVDEIFNAYIDGASATNVFDILKEVTGNVTTPENLKVIHLNQLAQEDELRAVLLPKRFLGPEYFYGIVFVNENLPLREVLVAGEDEPQLRFYVGGNRNDVDRFWADFKKQCAVHGTTPNEVVRMCARRSQVAINPYKFFTEHIGRYHFTLVSIQYTGYPTDLTLDHMPLRRLMPPWSAMLIQQQIQMGMEIGASGVSNDDLGKSDLPFMEVNFPRLA